MIFKWLLKYLGCIYKLVNLLVFKKKLFNEFSLLKNINKN